MRCAAMGSGREPWGRRQVRSPNPSQLGMSWVGFGLPAAAVGRRRRRGGAEAEWECGLWRWEASALGDGRVFSPSLVFLLPFLRSSPLEKQ